MDGKDFRKIEIVIEALRRHKAFQQLLEGSLPFMIYKVDTGQVLARGIYGYEQAKAKSNEIRKRLNLKWSEVKFKADRGASRSPATRSRIDRSPRYSPSKRGHFRVRMNPDGSTADID